MNTELMFSSKTDLWETPQVFFNEWDSRYHFTLDACALPENAKCRRYFTPEQDGLRQEWSGVVWCNPPYGRGIGKGGESCQVNGYRGYAAPCEDGYGMVSQLGAALWRNPLYQRAAEIRRMQKRRAVPVYGSRIRRGGSQ